MIGEPGMTTTATRPDVVLPSLAVGLPHPRGRWSSRSSSAQRESVVFTLRSR